MTEVGKPDFKAFDCHCHLDAEFKAKVKSPSSKTFTINFKMENRNWNIFIPFSVFVLFCLFPPSESHIRLTFPPARKYALDFLDNQRTFGPCGGMPAGTLRTTLKSGSTFNFTWEMGFMHKGNYQIELLNGNKIQELYTWEQSKNAKRITRSQEITLPEVECSGCSLRLLRAAREFSDNYIFWSCADVDIVKNHEENCSNRGRTVNGECKCHRGYVGTRCEFSQECSQDSDCGGSGRGKCIRIGNAEHKQQCFCKYPFFGSNCVKTYENAQNEVILGPNSLDLTKYKKVNLAQGYDLHYKIIGEGSERQIRIVLQSQGSSFVAVGWRPSFLTKDCKRKWPNFSLAYSNDKIRKRRGVAEAFKKEVEYLQAQNASGVEGYLSEDLLRRHEVAYAPFAAMDCTDIVIGTARGEYSRVLDYYTMDRSTPQPDTFWGGTDDLTMGAGWESSDGVTTIVFQKKVVNSPQLTDHDLNGELHFIWSRGQQQAKLIPGTEEAEFYAEDEIKYHGYGSVQRGFRKIRFL